MDGDGPHRTAKIHQDVVHQDVVDGQMKAIPQVERGSTSPSELDRDDKN